MVNTLFIEEDVFGRDISVDDFSAVAEVDSLHQLGHDGFDFLWRHLFGVGSFKVVPQIHIQEFEDQEEVGQ